MTGLQEALGQLTSMHWSDFLDIIVVAFLIYTYDERVTQNADEFFKMRSDAYSCELPDGYACKYRIKEWREDSVYWQTKVDKILKE